MKQEPDFIIGSRPRRYVDESAARPPRCDEQPSVTPVGYYTCPKCGERSYWNSPRRE